MVVVMLHFLFPTFPIRELLARAAEIAGSQCSAVAETASGSHNRYSIFPRFARLVIAEGILESSMVVKGAHSLKREC
jgi:hypothetical protein